MLKTGRLKSYRQEGGIVHATLWFPKSELVQLLDVVYDGMSKLPIGYEMTVAHPWQKTPKGMQVVETKIKCSSFRKISDKSPCDESNFFSYNKGKIVLKKYKEYTLYSKI